MDLHKLKPWNWFRREEQERAQPEVLPARRMDTDLLLRMHQEMDRLFEDFLGRAPQYTLSLHDALPNRKSVV